MRKAFIGLLILTLLAWAQYAFSAEPMLLARMNPYAAGVGAGAATTSYACVDSTHDSVGNVVVLCEDFDGTSQCTDSYTSNCRAAWGIIAGTPDYDNTENKTEGSYSLFWDLTVTNYASNYFALTAGDSYYSLIKIKVVAMPTAAKAVLNYLNNVTSHAFVRLNINGTVSIVSGAKSATTDTACAVEEGGEYWIWSHYQLGSGGNATGYVAVSTSLASKPSSGNCYAAFSDGAGTTQINRLGLGSGMTTDATLKVSYDHIRISTTDIEASAP